MTREERFEHITNPQKTLREVNDFLNVLEMCVTSSRVDSEVQTACPSPGEIEEMETKLREIRDYDMLREFTHGFATPNRNLFLPVNSQVIQRYLSHKDIQKGLDILRDVTEKQQLKTLSIKKQREQREMRGEDVGPERKSVMRRPVFCSNKMFELFGITLRHYNKQVGRNLEFGGDEGDEQDKSYYTRLVEGISQPATMKDIESVQDHMQMWEPIFNPIDPENPVKHVISCGGLQSFNPVTGLFTDENTTVDKIFNEHFQNNRDDVIEIENRDVGMFKQRFKHFMKDITVMPLNPVVEHIQEGEDIVSAMQRELPKDVVYGEEIIISSEDITLESEED